MSYNLTFMDNVTNPLGVMAGVNTASDGILFIAILFFFWLVLFISFNQFPIKDRLAASSFIVTAAGGTLLGTGLIEWWVLVFPLIALLSALLFKIWGDS